MSHSQKGKTLKRLIWMVVILALAIAAVLYFAGSKKPAYDEEDVKTRDIETYYSFTGNLAPQKTAVITAGNSSKVRSLSVSEKDVVVKDDVLMKNTAGGEYKAPISGTVTDIYYEKDDTYRAGAELLRIADYAHPEITIKVDEYDISALKEGMEVSVYIQALEETLTGAIESINREATVGANIAYYEATVSVPQDGTLFMGMTCEVTLPKDQALSVPTLAISSLQFDENGHPYVYCYDRKGEVVTQAVTLGVNNGTFVEIKDGLKSGDTVLTPRSRVSMMSPMAMMGRDSQ